MRTYLACRYGFVSSVQDESSSFFLNRDFVANLPSLRVVARERFITNEVLLVVPADRSVVNGVAVEDWSAAFPKCDATLRVFLDGYDLRRLRIRRERQDEYHHQHCGQHKLVHHEAMMRSNKGSRQMKLRLGVSSIVSSPHFNLPVTGL